MRSSVAFIGFASALLAAGAPLASIQRPTPPLSEGWRAPTPAETNQDFRGESPERYLRASADFDGDCHRDEALLLVSDARAVVALFVFLTRSGSPEAHQLYVLDAPYLPTMGISTASLASIASSAVMTNRAKRTARSPSSSTRQRSPRSRTEARPPCSIGTGLLDPFSSFGSATDGDTVPMVSTARRT